MVEIGEWGNLINRNYIKEKNTELKFAQRGYQNVLVLFNQLGLFPLKAIGILYH